METTCKVCTAQYGTFTVKVWSGTEEWEGFKLGVKRKVTQETKIQKNSRTSCSSVSLHSNYTYKHEVIQQLNPDKRNLTQMIVSMVLMWRGGGGEKTWFTMLRIQ